MTSLTLVPRTGQMILLFGISSSGDDGRTVDIPFGTLANKGGSIAIPKALKASIQSASGIPISSSDVVCQAFKDPQGTQVLGKSFTLSEASTLGPEPVTIGAIFCSDAKSVKARIGGKGDGSEEASSAGSDESTTVNAQSTRAQSRTTPAQAATTIASVLELSSAVQSVLIETSSSSTRTKNPQPTTPSPLPAIDPSGNGGKPKTVQQTSMIMMDTSSAPAIKSAAAATSSALATSKRPVSASSKTSVTSTPSSRPDGSSSAAAAQSTSAATGIRTQEVWTLKRLVNISILATCYVGWFMM